MRRLLLDKKGQSDDVIFPIVIFVVVNLAFFSILVLFVYRSSSDFSFYEQAYAKEIAMFIDSAKSGTSITIDFTKGYEFSEKNKFGLDSNNALISMKNSSVIVKLSSKTGYSVKTFSDLESIFYFDKQNNNLRIEVK